MIYPCALFQKCLKILKGQSETVNRGTDNTMGRQYNGQTIQWADNTMDRQYNGQTIQWAKDNDSQKLHRTLKIEQHELH